jgi:hypothetical protein
MVKHMLTPLLILASYLPANDSRGSALYGNCKASIRSSETSIPNRDDDINGMNCLEYITGFTDAFTISENTSRGTLVRIYVAYMDKYPKLLDEDRGIGVWGALASAYPCSTH